MITKEFTYVDYNGLERTEKCRFNLTDTELTMMQMSVTGGMKEHLQRISEAVDMPAVMENLKMIIHKAYGEISPDGRRFVKKAADGHDLASDFEETIMYDMLLIELLSDADAASAFMNGLMPHPNEKKASVAEMTGKVIAMPGTPVINGGV